MAVKEIVFDPPVITIVCQIEMMRVRDPANPAFWKISKTDAGSLQHRLFCRPVAKKRRDGLIVLMNNLFIPHNIWYFRRGLPIKYTGPSMNAGQSNVAIESMEIAHEGVYMVPGVAATASVAESTANVL